MTTIYSRSPFGQFQSTVKPLLKAMVEVRGSKKEGSDLYFITEEYIARKLEMVHADAKQYIYKLDNVDLESYRVIANDNTCPLYKINKADLRYRISKHRHVASCAYSATESYLKTLFGVTLHHTDHEWYKNNALVTGDGLPLNHTFQVLEQLVEPYGFRISNIQVNRGQLLSKDNNIFKKVLGTNPFYAIDNITTNDEAYERLFPKEVLESMLKSGAIKSIADHKESVFSTWRFECRDEPTGTAVTMCQFDKIKTGHNGGSSFMAPRSPRPNKEHWIFSIKFDRKENCKFSKPDLPEYVEYEGEQVINWQDSIFRGKPLFEKFVINTSDYSKYRSHHDLNDNIDDYLTGHDNYLSSWEDDLKRQDRLASFDNLDFNI